jgi:nucleoid-associated protein YgaU
LITVFASFSWAAEVEEDAAFPPDPDMPMAAEPAGEAPPAETTVVNPAEAPAETTEVTPIEPETSATEVTAVEESPAVEAASAEASAPSETPFDAPAETSGSAHRVVPGDTLWDLAGSYLHNPFLWSKIWEANRGMIENPDRIYPDQQFVIPGVSAAGALEAPATAAAAPAEPLVETASAPAPWEEKAEETPDVPPMPSEKTETVAEAPGGGEAEVVDSVDEALRDEQDAIKRKAGAVRGAGFMGGTADTFIADKDWEYDGYVLRDRDQKMMISQGDVVYLNVGASAGVAPKMVANIYRLGQKVKDPYLKRQAGRMVKRVGTVIVTTEVSEQGCTAVVINSMEPIRIGDLVKFTTAR